MLLVHQQPRTMSSPGRQSVERRRGLRVLQNRPVKIFEPLAGKYFGGQTEDISATGLRLELPAAAALRPGKVLNIHPALPGMFARHTVIC